MSTAFRLGSPILIGLFGLFGLVAPTAALAAEPALALAFNDARLEWGPCPSFMPEGCEIAVLHGDPAKPNADVLFKVPAGSAIPRHWHTSAERMVLLSGELQVVYDGQPTVTLTSGMYAYGPAKLPHKAYCNKGESCVLFIAFESPVDATPDSGIPK
jgi:quercetin dioxygenase-like cupin family protein